MTYLSKKQLEEYKRMAFSIYCRAIASNLKLDLQIATANPTFEVLALRGFDLVQIFEDAYAQFTKELSDINVRR